MCYGVFLFGFLEFVLKLVLIQKVLFTCKLLTGVEFKLLCLPMAVFVLEVAVNWLAMSVKSSFFR